jgi:hypothetical protein
MRFRLLTFVTLITFVTFVGSVLIFGGKAARKAVVSVWQLDATRNVSLGTSVFSPATLPLRGNSVLTVAVTTGALVPANGIDGVSPIKAVVQISENNVNNISHTITPSLLQTVDLAGGGRASPATFTFNISSQNSTTGTISYRATLIRLENNAGLAQTANPLTSDAALTIGPAPTPTPTPTPTPDEAACFPEDCSAGNGHIGGYWDPTICACEYSPILVDISGNGFKLTDAPHGVDFDLEGRGIVRRRVAWTAADSDDAFLTLDRNENGKVDNGTELFGDMTPQPYASVPNGFVALSMYDQPLLGGNDDGVIDARDTVYAELRLWQDKNHNGVSEPEELHTLRDLGVASLELNYRESKRVDDYGNRFRFRAKVKDVRGAQLGRWAWDVFLVPGH